MNGFNFKDVNDTKSNRFADSALGRIIASIQDVTIEYSYNIEGICPRENGKWSGERGNSKWIPEKTEIPQKSNPDNLTWEQILEKYGIDGIRYSDGEPNFDKISKGNVDIDGFSSRRPDNFNKADIELAKKRGCSPEDVKRWRHENNYTWHECKNMKTMQKVPSVVHNNMAHSGGVSEAKKRGL